MDFLFSTIFFVQDLDDPNILIYSLIFYYALEIETDPGIIPSENNTFRKQLVSESNDFKKLRVFSNQQHVLGSNIIQEAMYSGKQCGSGSYPF